VTLPPAPPPHHPPLYVYIVYYTQHETKHTHVASPCCIVTKTNDNVHTIDHMPMPELGRVVVASPRKTEDLPGKYCSSVIYSTVLARLDLDRSYSISGLT
jgi:hypothetical protein